MNSKIREFSNAAGKLMYTEFAKTFLRKQAEQAPGVSWGKPRGWGELGQIERESWDYSAGILIQELLTLCPAMPINKAVKEKAAMPDCKSYYEIHDADGFYIGLRAHTRRDAILEEWPSANIVSSDTSFNFTEYTLEYDGARFEVMVYGSLT